MDRKIEEQFIKSLFSGNGYMQTPLEELEALRQAAEYSAAAYKEAKARFEKDYIRVVPNVGNKEVSLLNPETGEMRPCVL